MSATTRRFRPGTVYKDGKLYQFTTESVMVVRPWPDPRAWRLGASGGWTAARPMSLDLSAPETLRFHTAPRWHLRCQARAFARIPEERRLAAARFGRNAWALHNLFSRVPGALELADNCPALAAGLALGHQCLRPSVTQPFRTARALLRRPGPQTARRVAERLGFEPSRAVVRVLRKLDPALCDANTLDVLRQGMCSPVLRKCLLHAPELYGAVLILLGFGVGPDRMDFGGRLLHEAVTRGPHDAWEMVLDIGALKALWRKLWLDRPVPHLASFSAVRRLLDQTRRELNRPCRLRQYEQERGGLPEPPLMGGLIDDMRILPLRSVDELLEEGQAMHHCLGTRTYVEACAERRGYCYRVEPCRPESGPSVHRATLWVEPDEQGEWDVQQLRAEGNAPVSYTVIEIVVRWLEFQHHPGRVFSRPEEESRGRTLRVVRHRPWRRETPPPRFRPPPSAGEQLSLDFNMPF